MSKKLADRKFVTFDSVQIDVDTIQALAYQLQQRTGTDAANNPVTVNVQVAVLMLESGSSVTIGDDSLKKFEHWWQANVKSEKVVLPAPVVEAVASPAAANTDKPAAAPAPAPVAKPAPEPVAAAPEVPQKVVKPAAPSPAAPTPDTPAEPAA